MEYQDDYSHAYVTGSLLGWIITGVETPLEYADGIIMAPAMVGPFNTEQAAHDELLALTVR